MVVFKSISTEFIKKLQSFIIVFICSSLFVYQAWMSIDSFLKEETGTRIFSLPTSQVDFPELLFCPSDPYNLTLLKENGIESITE